MLAYAVPAMGFFDAERRLRHSPLHEGRALGPDGALRAQFAGAAQLAVDEGAEDEIAGAETIFGVADQKFVGYAAAEAIGPAG